MITAGTRPRRRWESGERYRDRIAPDAPMLPVVRILLATAYGYGCRFAEARDELAAALALPAGEGSEVHRGYAAVARAFYVDFWTGRPHDALRCLEAAIAELEARDPEDRLSFRLFARMLHSYLMLDLGRFEEALAFTEALREDFRRLRRRARGPSLLHVDGLDGAGRPGALGRAGRGCSRHPSRARPGGDLATPIATSPPVALLAAAQGDAAEVAARIAAARDQMREFGVDLRRVVVPVRLRARPPTRWASPRSPTSRHATRSTRRWPSTPRGPTRARRSSAAHVGEGAQGGDAHLAEALALTDEHDLDELWTGRERLAAPGLLARALAGGIGPPGVAERVLAGCGGQALAEVLRPHRGRRAGRPGRASPSSWATPGRRHRDGDRLLRDRDPSVREAARRSWMRLKARPRAAISIVSLGEFRVLRDGVRRPERGLRAARRRAPSWPASSPPGGRCTARPSASGSGPSSRPTGRRRPSGARSTTSAARSSRSSRRGARSP